MSYQVLARQWRPKSFADLVGQEHVVRALSNALDRDRLHHAYLFTGTRGVGKTTLARILAKALNCERGVSSSPCGVCTACTEIDTGRFVDLLEVDAASRTKVDQTRELLENVPYAPAHARYKVYLIDEVHMFSAGSFNALLKTLEEPPSHVKFLLATTDPQRIPVTVLSRCLQFSLRRLVPAEIRERLQLVLDTEGLSYEPAALALLARAADGSMRDALSLLDQAIAFGGGQVRTDEVQLMLGAAGDDQALALVEALAQGDGAAVLATVERIAAQTPDFPELLRVMLGCWHRLAIMRQVPEILGEDEPHAERLRALAGRLAPEDIQLFYQIGLIGQRDLALAPDPRSGFEMVLLRALAFRPAGTLVAIAPQASAVAAVGRSFAASAHSAPVAPASAATPPPIPREPTWIPELPLEPPPAAAPADERPRLDSPQDWHTVIHRLGLKGMASELVNHCAFESWREGRLHLRLDPAARQLLNPNVEKRVHGALERTLGTAVRLTIEVAPPGDETLARRRQREEAARLVGAETALAADPLANRLRERLDADWVPGSIEAPQPRDDEAR